MRLPSIHVSAEIVLAALWSLLRGMEENEFYMGGGNIRNLILCRVI